MHRSKKKSAAFFHYLSLEPRQMLAAATFSGDTVLFEGSSGNDSFSVVQLPSSDLIEIRNDGILIRQFNANDIASVQFAGEAGDDVLRFVNVTSLALDLFKFSGGDGNDFLLNEDSAFNVGKTQVSGGRGNDLLDIGFIAQSNGLSSDSEVFGDAGDDRILGSNVNDRIFGNSGDDLIYGRGGGDEIYGDSNDFGSPNTETGNDFIDGGSGDDQIWGRDGNDEIRGGSTITLPNGELEFGGADRIFSGNGDDTIDGGDGWDLILGGDGEDKIFGGWGDDHIEGGSGNDFLFGGFGKDYLAGRDGDDVVHGGEGDDQLTGQADGFDQINNDQYFGNGGDDQFTTGDPLQPGLFNGGPGNDTFNGVSDDGAGENDSSEGPMPDFGLPRDAFPVSLPTPISTLPSPSQPNEGTVSFPRFLSITGTLQNDTITVSADRENSALKVTGLGEDGSLEQLFPAADVRAIRFKLLAGDDTVTFQGDSSFNLHNVDFFGDNGNDTLTIITAPNSFEEFNSAIDFLPNNFPGINALAGPGNDRIEVIGAAFPTSGENFSPLGSTSRLRGEDGDDVLIGGDGDSSLFGGAGNDTLIGGNGNDSILGGTGRDALIGNGGNDFLDGDAGDDTISGHEGEDRLTGGAGDDTIFGGEGNDRIFGDESFRLPSGSGDDQIFGGDGDDTIMGGNGDDTINGGDGSDEIWGDGFQIFFFNFGSREEIFGDGNDQIRGGNGDDTIDGGAGNDLVDAGNGNDRIVGGSGDDTLRGGIGDDFISGDAGNDNLNGWFGADILVGGSGDDLLVGGAGNDLLEGVVGSNVLLGQGGNDRLYGGENEDFVAGGAGDDQVYGTRRGYVDNPITDDGVGDIIRGGAGSDVFFVANDFLPDFDDEDDVFATI